MSDISFVRVTLRLTGTGRDSRYADALFPNADFPAMTTISVATSPATEIKSILLVLESDIFLNQFRFFAEVDDETGCSVYPENRRVDAEVVV